MTEPGSRALVTSPTRTVRAGSVIGTARMPYGTPKTWSQVCGTMLAHRPVLTCAKSAATESVSTRGDGRTPASANSSSSTRRPCMAPVSRQSGSRDASAQVAVVRWASPSAASVGSTYRSSYSGTDRKASESPLCR
ncbi:hypothetical protein EES42_18015 [Streptomyces sp. ADI95-17]|nr:hypothetical protein EES42_18015 [Streptomyces sp. ADI95-17]